MLTPLYRRFRTSSLFFLLFFVSFVATAQWRTVTGQTDLDSQRFDTPEQAQQFLKSYYTQVESIDYQYLIDWINPELSYPDGRYSFRICFTPKTSDITTFDPTTCSAGTTSGHLHTDFLVPVDMAQTTLLNKNFGAVCRASGQDDSTVVGNPINTSNGNKYEQERDYVGIGRSTLEFTRYYNSKLALANPRAAWQHTYSAYVEADPAKYGTATVVLHRPDGQQLAFYRLKDTWQATWTTSEKLAEVNGVFAAETVYLNGSSYKAAPTKFQNDGWVYTRGDAVVETYDHGGNLKQISYPDGSKETLSYSDDGLTSVVDSYGRTLTLTSRDHQIQSLTTPDGSITDYQYSNDGLLQSVTRPDGHSRHYLYEDGRNSALLTGIVDERGVRFASWTYDADLKANSSEHAGGTEKTNITYNADGSVTTTGALGHSRTLTFSAHNGVYQPDQVIDSAATGVNAGSTSYTFSSQGFLTRKTNQEGQAFGYAYNARGLETQRTSADGGTISTTWHSTVDVPLKITTPTLVIDYTYDDKLHVIAIKQTERSGSGSRSWLYNWNNDPLFPGQLLSIDGPRTDVSDVSTYEYDNQGNITAITDALGQTTHFQSFDGNGNPQQITLPNGVQKSLTYDYRGDLTSITDLHGSVALTRDPQGRLISATLQDGSVSGFEYDDAGRLTALINAKGERREYSLDAENNITAIRQLDATGSLRWKELRTYNELSYLTALTDGTGNVSSFTWDRVANLISETDPAGHTTQNTYDGFNHQTKQTDAVGAISNYRYDGNGRLTTVTDPRSKNTSYTRNGFGNVVSQVSPDSGTTTFTYDNAGNLTSRTNALGQKTSFSYDALNRLTGVSSSVSGTSPITLSYANTGVDAGQLTAITDDAGSAILHYNDQGKIASVLREVSARSYAVAYAYDDVGRRLSVTYPSGRVLHYQRDTAGDITGLSLDDQNGQSVQLAQGIAYEPEGPLSHLTFGNGLSEDRTYNLSYQTQSITVGNVLNRSYEYSPDGNIINARDELNPAYGHVVSYDAIDRMVQSSGWYGVYSFTYDANGNKTSITRSGTKDTYSISTSNNYLTKTSVGAVSYTHDAMGNITKRGADTFTYNGYGQLTGATVNGTVAQYKYDVNNQRVSKTVAGQTTLYIYDNDGRLLSEANASTGAITREYVWLGNKPVAYLFGDKGYYVHTDNTETPQLLTNAQGDVVWTIQTYPFGKQTFSGSVTFNLRYPGQYYDEESGLHYNWHRYYDPNTGRYMSSDPIGLAGGLNTYAYVGNDPLGSVDPLGLDAEESLHTKPISIAPENVNSEINESGGPGESPYQNLQVLDFSGVIASAGGNVCGINVSKNRYPESSDHIIDAIKLGKPITLTIDRKNAASRRREALKNTAPVKNLDRDEYPPAMFKEGGRDASVRLITPRDNRGAGSCIGSQCRNLPDGTKIKINIVE